MNYFKRLVALLVTSLSLISCSANQTITFNKVEPELSNSDMVSCELTVSQSAFANVSGKSEPTRSFGIEMKSSEPIRVDLVDLNTGNPKAKGNNGTYSLVQLGPKSALGYVTFMESEASQLGTASIYSYNTEFHQIIWTKNYGGYAHVGVGYCK